MLIYRFLVPNVLGRCNRSLLRNTSILTVSFNALVKALAIKTLARQHRHDTQVIAKKQYLNPKKQEV